MTSENNTETESINPLNLRFTDTEILKKKYITGTGKILPRRITKLTARQQRHVTKVIKQARNLLLMP